MKPLCRQFLAALATLAIAQPAAAARPPAGTPNCEGVDDQPATLAGAESFTYRTASDRELRIHVFVPQASTERPAILFFFGGGWRRGTVAQFAAQAQAFQAAGYVAALADYRVFCRDTASPLDAVEDAQAAYAWFRARSGQFGVDPQRIALSGGSSGGQLAMATAQTAPQDARPAALVLFNPAADLTPPMIRNAIGLTEAQAQQISPSVLPVAGLGPTIIFHGEADQVAPIRQARAFCDRVRAAEGQCEVEAYAGQPHGFFNNRTPNAELGRSPYEDTLAGALAFLAGLGWR